MSTKVKAKNPKARCLIMLNNFVLDEGDPDDILGMNENELLRKIAELTPELTSPQHLMLRDWWLSSKPVLLRVFEEKQNDTKAFEILVKKHQLDRRNASQQKEHATNKKENAGDETEGFHFTVGVETIDSLNDASAVSKEEDCVGGGRVDKKKKTYGKKDSFADEDEPSLVEETDEKTTPPASPPAAQRVVAPKTPSSMLRRSARIASLYAKKQQN